MSIYDLDAGRELDALISEKVMGVPVHYRPDISNGKEPCIGVRTDDTGPIIAPYYSMDIAAAWQVVEKLGVGFEIHYDYEPDKPSQPWLAGWEWLEGCAMYQSRAETAPLAICLAALKAMGAA